MIFSVNILIINLLKYFMKFLLYFALVATAFATFGVDVSTQLSFENFQCIKYDWNIYYTAILGYTPRGIDPNVISSLSNAKLAGFLYRDIYMTPCRGKNATNQVVEMMNGIPSTLYGGIWIEILENNQEGCSWAGHDAKSNCAYLTELLNAVKARGKSVGVLSQINQWISMMGMQFACSMPSYGASIWYTYTAPYSAASFKDWTALKFGGWVNNPNLKRYQANVSTCGVYVNRLFF